MCTISYLFRHLTCPSEPSSKKYKNAGAKIDQRPVDKLSSSTSLLRSLALVPIAIALSYFVANILRSPASLQTLFKRASSTLAADVSANMVAKESVRLIPRPSTERGHADHGWLKSFHTFSFADYQDWNHMQFGSLRVINEDRVSPKTGFGTHGHREFEIFSYVVKGELRHNDSMGNMEILKRGDLQMTSTGTGIRHSEYQHGPKPVHFLQIWSMPSQQRLPPTYYTRHFTEEEKTDKWAHVVAPHDDVAHGVSTEREASGPAPVHSPLSLFATILSQGKTVTQKVERSKAYVHLIQTSGYNPGEPSGATVKLSVGGKEQTLREGDGVYVHLPEGTHVAVENVGDRTAEVLLFDLE